MRIDAETVISHLLNYVDPIVIDEAIGRTAATGRPPRTARYLLVAAREWAHQHMPELAIPDPNRPSATIQPDDRDRRG